MTASGRVRFRRLTVFRVREKVVPSRSRETVGMTWDTDVSIAPAYPSSRSVVKIELDIAGRPTEGPYLYRPVNPD